ncbi:MAG: DNA mismatch repair protein MutS [Kiritimatiellae bacterium]|nr:DNA mismatch repair protein MutS [Kiritimatiellia bacterium]
MARSPAATPMMGQYRKIKAQLAPGTLLFFRLGDFYEMFFDDAVTASEALGLTLTHRQGAPMCGIPYHAYELYMARLLRAGYKVAICEQMEDPALAKGLVRRELTGIVTPGTALADAVLEEKRSNYLAAVVRGEGLWGLAMLELSTGEFRMGEAAGEEELAAAVTRDAPSEVVLPEPLAADDAFVRRLQAGGRFSVTPREEWTFDAGTAEDVLARHFAVRSLDGFGATGHPAAVAAAGALLHYVAEDLHRSVSHVRSLRFRVESDVCQIDEATSRNLDIVPARDAAHPEATLLGVMDVTRTPMGSRLLRDWMLRPLRKPAAIEARLDAVGALLADRRTLERLREALGGVKDIERLANRLSAGSGNARDAKALAASLRKLPAVREALAAAGAGGLLSELDAAMDPEEELAAEIASALVDEPPLSLKDGGLFREGYDETLDGYRHAARGGREWIAELQAKEIARTGIRTLKIRYTRAFGFFIEVTKSYLSQVPPDYERRQTLVGAERFVTAELKEVESRILGADEKAKGLEYELFNRLREKIAARTGAIQETGRAIAAADVLAAFADRALYAHYVRPAIGEDARLDIRGGRHPVVESIETTDRFVPNDVALDAEKGPQIALITGPNMAGKSTFIRQVALIVVMAQMGSFVPADAAYVGLADKVFTRVGAGDDLARGRSTFMVEMQETANILNNATAKSLVVLDEIGRGTSTFDGISLAWATAEYLHDIPAVKARTLFATHYHELTDIARSCKGIANFSVAVKEQGRRIVFLRKIVPGPADKSYGIEVARLAGMPEKVVSRAREILENLEENELAPDTGAATLARPRAKKPKIDLNQLSLFE